jgi:formylglycine-generating enzyme required for sulfatase activity
MPGDNCNSAELGLEDTTPVGIFTGGASPYGCLDMVGNVWEWTRSLWGSDMDRLEFKYPYDPKDGREDLEAPYNVLRVLRGGAFWSYRWYVRCAFHNGPHPDLRHRSVGFRVVLLP